MNTLPCLFSLVLISVMPLAAAQSIDAASAAIDVRTAVMAADEERMAAMKSGDAARLDAILSDEVRYAHSNGAVDNKGSLTNSLVSRKTVYESFDYKERTIMPVGPGVAVMSGRVLVRVGSSEQKNNIDLNYLAVWRQENGRWRFLAWQSCRNPAPPPPATK